MLLPLATAPPTEASRAEVPGRCPRRVLIIDDNPDLLESLGELLRLDGHEVLGARDGPEGLAAARAFRGDAALARTHLVALTGYASPEDVRRSAEAGYDRHLAKPASPDELRRTLAEVPVKGEGTCGGCR